MKSFGDRLSRLKNFPSGKAASVLLAVMGLTMISAGVWMIFAPAGLITGGLSALLLEHRVDMNMSAKREGRSG